jgi:hypothetical protein
VAWARYPDAIMVMDPARGKQLLHRLWRLSGLDLRSTRDKVFTCDKRLCIQARTGCGWPSAPACLIVFPREKAVNKRSPIFMRPLKATFSRCKTTSWRFDGGSKVLSFPGFHQLFFLGDCKRELLAFGQLYNIETRVV